MPADFRPKYLIAFYLEPSERTAKRMERAAALCDDSQRGRAATNSALRHSEPAERGEESQITKPEILRRLRRSGWRRVVQTAAKILRFAQFIRVARADGHARRLFSFFEECQRRPGRRFGGRRLKIDESENPASFQDVTSMLIGT